MTARHFAAGEIVTSAILSTPLQASAKPPAGVATMLRTTPPPDGIGHCSKLLVFGSKRTSMFCSAPVSTYQTSSPSTAIA